MITLDFETYYDRDFSLSKMTTEEYVRDKRFEALLLGVKIDDHETFVLSGGNIKTWLTTNKDFIAQHVVVAHNAMFDGFILSEVFGVHPKMLLCTMSMAYGAYGPNLPSYSLKELVTTHGLPAKGTEVGNMLGVRSMTPEQVRAYSVYCANDVEITKMLFDVLKKKLTVDELRLIDLTMKMYTDPAIVIDSTVVSRYLDSYNDRLSSLLTACGTTADNLRSNTKFAELLRKFGIQPPVKKSPKTGKEALALAKSDPEYMALLEHEDERVQLLVEARIGMRSTIGGTRAARFLGMSQRGPMPIPLVYHGTHTGRWSGFDKINLQNLPKKDTTNGGVHPLRKCLTVPDGFVMIASDSSQIEARVIATLAGEEWLIDAFREGRDVYCEFGTTAFGREITKKDEMERFVAKGVVLGSGFGLGGVSLARNLNAGAVGGVKLTFDKAFLAGVGGSTDLVLGSEFQMNRAIESKPVTINMDDWMVHVSAGLALINAYRGKNKKIVRLWSTLDGALLSILGERPITYYECNGMRLQFEKGAIVLPSGRRIYYRNVRRDGDRVVYDSKRSRSSYEKKNLYGGAMTENVVQAIARDIIATQMLAIAKKYKVLSMTHDEVIFMAPSEEAQEALDFSLNVMSDVCPFWAKSIPLGAEGRFANNYGDCK